MQLTSAGYRITRAVTSENGMEIMNMSSTGSMMVKKSKKTQERCIHLCESFYYLPGVTWSGVTSSKNSFRAYGSGFIFDSGANGFFPTDTTKINVFTAYLNSCVSQYVLNIINPTINTGAGTVKKIPIILSDNPEIPPKIEQLADDNVSISITDWDSYETSWDFKRSPLV